MKQIKKGQRERERERIAVEKRKKEKQIKGFHLIAVFKLQKKKNQINR